MGTNAISITPFSFMRNPAAAVQLPYSDGPGAENDESVVHAARTAQDLDMVVMLKPHIWLRNSWPGEIEMASPQEWDRFFTYYFRWIAHYALLAQMQRVEILCVGVELSKATVGHEERWREIFSNLRLIYGGALTYAANWGSEFETVSFWDDLDYMGINCYYPLSDEPGASDQALEQGVARILTTIERVARAYDRRVIITEIGFCSTPSPWVKPFERERGVTVDLEAQARCYEIFLSGLGGRPEYAGIYWWKWPSFLEYGGSQHSGFTPNGKTAEEIVRKWYGSILNAEED